MSDVTDHITPEEARRLADDVARWPVTATEAECERALRSLAAQLEEAQREIATLGTLLDEATLDAAEATKERDAAEEQVRVLREALGNIRWIEHDDAPTHAQMVNQCVAIAARALADTAPRSERCCCTERGGNLICPIHDIAPQEKP